MFDSMQTKPALASSEQPVVVVPPAKRPAGSGALLNSRWLGVAFIALLLILWEIAAATAIFPPMSFPRISAIVATWWQLVISGELVGEVLSSLWRMFAG
jgi:ABC-type nitrate/sulfonate/bicarbonate transport system permease component